MKLLRPRLAVASPRLRVPKVEAADPFATERATLYGSAQWKRLRARLIADGCACCGSREERHLDHLLGHSDIVALPLLRALGLPEQNWRARFFHGPFVSLCGSCHSSKTRHELTGQLAAWLRTNEAALGLGHILWY